MSGDLEASPPAEDRPDRSVLERLIACSGAQDPGALAGVLLDEFGSLGAAIHGSDGGRFRRRVADPRVAEVLGAVREAMTRVLRARASERDVLSGHDDVLRYLRFVMAFDTRECLRVLHLDVAHALIADEVVSTGTVDANAFYPREIVARALELGAVSLVLAHNHPSGSPSASADDVHATHALATTCAGLGIRVLDHVIVAAGGALSMRRAGLLAA